MNAMNGKTGPISVNPQEVARAALVFLSRADLKPPERQTFDMVEAMLSAIAQGNVQLQEVPREPIAPPDIAPAPAPEAVQ